MASLTIMCGQSRSSRRSNNSLGGYLPSLPKTKASHRQVTRVMRSVPSNNRFSALAIDTSVRRAATGFRGPRPSTAAPATGSWRSRMTVNTAPVKEKRCLPVSKQAPAKKVLPRLCAYCHDKVNVHHIRDCPVLAEKNRLKAEKARQHKAIMREEKKRKAELRLAEQVRLAQEQSNVTVEVIDDVESDDDSDADTDFPRLQKAIDSGFVSTRRGSRRVTFKGDNVDTLMKPPCETKIFDSDAPPSAVSSDEDTQVYPDEEEYLKLKRAKTAWRPRFQMTAHEQQKMLDAQKKVKKKSWADMCDDESDDEDDFDQFGRPTTDNSDW